MLARLLTLQSRSAAWLLVFCMILTAGCEVLSVAAVYPFAALASDPKLLEESDALAKLYDLAGRPSLTQFVVELAAVFLFSFLLTTLSNALTLWMQQRYVLRLRHRLATQLLRGYLAKEHSWFLHQHTADLSKNVLAETDRLCQEVVTKLTTIGSRGLSALLICLTLLAINPWVAILCSATLLVTYRQIYGFFRTRLDGLGRRRLEMNQRRHQLAQESLSAIKEARLGHRRHLLHLEFEQESLAYTRLDLKQRLIAEMPRYLTETLAIVAIVGVFCYLVSLGRDPRQAFPWIGLYIMAIFRLVPNLQELYACLVDVRLNWPLLEKLDQDWIPVSEAGTGGKLSLQDSLVLESVSYAYPSAERKAVHEISLQIRRHQLVALVGKTGSGKTTVADLLAGQLEPQDGRVLVDGQPMQRQAWQASVGYVPQTIYLSSDTLRRNIALGLPEAQIEQDAVEHAAAVAHLESLLPRLPKGLDTLLGERGLSLSGGERQRVGIARALYHQPEVLILDEATSALDNHTEKAVMGAIELLTQRHTIVLIAHRLSTVKNCDRIFVFEDGRLVSQGSYAELLEICPTFLSLQNELSAKQSMPEIT